MLKIMWKKWNNITRNILRNLKIKSKAHANELDIRGIQREVEKHSLKLNASNGKQGGVWQLHSDDEK